jgi:Flp pilus assembly protein TadG
MTFRKRPNRKNERGSTLAEFAIAALVFFIALFSVLEIARMLWTYNALADGVRRGARWAALNAPGSASTVKNVVMYGTTSAGSQTIVHGLNTNHIQVNYSGDFGVHLGSVSVTLTNFQFEFLTLPDVLGASLTFPDYQVTLTGESAGCVPTAADPDPCE